MGQRLAVIGFALAVILAIYLFTQQQTTLQHLENAQTAQADSDERQTTAVAMAQAAISGQASAEAGQSAAVATAQNAGTAQANSDTQRETAVANANSAQTLSDLLAQTATAQFDVMQAAGATATLQANQQATQNAETTAELSTQQAQIDAQSTTQAGFDAALGTATAQVDLAQFALRSAEQDRATALANYWLAATVVSQQAETQVTAQAIVSGVTGTPRPTTSPATAAPTAALQVTTTPGATAAAGTIPPLTESYTTNDKKTTFNYPQGWFTGENSQGVIIVVNTQAIVQRNSNDLQSGEVEIEMLIGPATNIQGITAGATTGEILKSIQDFYNSQAGTSAGDSSDLKIGSYDASRFEGKEGNNAVAVTVVDIGSGNIILSFEYTYPGEVSQYTQAYNDILASVQHTQ